MNQRYSSIQYFPLKIHLQQKLSAKLLAEVKLEFNDANTDTTIQGANCEVSYRIGGDPCHVTRNWWRAISRDIYDMRREIPNHFKI